MSDNRASIIELENEFNRAMALLTGDPLPSDDIETFLCELDCELGNAWDVIGGDGNDGNHDHMCADHLVRIAAIALDGAARLRRTK
jgi:hypothetical protein